jgi:DNA repair photolyase
MSFHKEPGRRDPSMPTDLRSHLLALVAPLAIGDAVLPGLRLIDVSFELGLRMTFETDDGRALHVEVAPLEERRPAAATSARLSFAYRADGDAAHVDGGLAAKLCAAIATRARANEDEVLARIARDAAEARASDEGGARVRQVRVDRLLERAGALDERYFTLSPYVGCLVGCRFCYAQDRVASVRRLEQLTETPWGSYVDVRVNAAEVLARELTELPPWPIKFCPIVSDPYQAVEARFGITAQCLDVLAREPSPRTVLVLTRARAIVRDAARIAALPRGYAGMSIPTADEAVLHHFEPRGASAAERIDALRTLRDAGARTFVVVQPMLPGSVDALADAIAGVASSARIDVLHGVQGAASDFADAHYAFAQDDTWQRERAEQVATALRARGVALWKGELPP